MANNIYIGDISSPSFSFDDDSIISINSNMSVNVISQELPADTFEFEVEYEDNDRALRNLLYATTVYYYKDEEQVAFFYFTNITRIGVNRYALDCTSFVGLIDKEISYGFLFNGTPFNLAVIRAIGTDGINGGSYLPLTKYSFSGSRKQAVLLSSNGKGAATYQSKIELKFTIADTYFATSSDSSHYVWGSSRDSSSFVSYGITYLFRTLYLRYNSYTYTITNALASDKNNEITISFDPVSGELHATHYVDGVLTRTRNDQYSPTIPTGNPKIYVAGIGLDGDSLTTRGPITIIWEYCRVYDQSDNLQIDVFPTISTVDGSLVLNEGVTGFSAASEYASGSLSDVDYDRDSQNSDIMSFDPLEKSILQSISFDDAIESLPLSGWIPICTKREALYQMLFAMRISIVRDGNKYKFTRLINTIVGTISDNSIYNSGSVKEKEDVQRIELTEHDFSAIDSSRTIFDNLNSSEAANNSIVEFSHAPIYGTPTIAETRGDFQLISYNCNVALVSGKGKLTGTPYIHGKKIINKKIDGTIRGKTVSVNGATLVTTLNSQAVMERLISFYNSAYEVHNSFIYGNSAENEHPEKCGSRYSFNDCFKDSQYGFLQKMSLNVSEKVKANGNFVCGFISPENNDYSNFVMLTGSGTWSVPDGVTQLYVILIGGGTGGESGRGGQDGDRPRYDGENEWRSTVKAEGGEPGETGNPGKIYAFTLTSLAQNYDYSCGSGGIGGSGTLNHEIANPGGAGGSSTLTGGGITYSSESGSVVASGWINFFDGHRYAYKPEYWKNGAGKGGDGGYYVIDYEGNVTYYQAEDAYNEIENYSSYAGANGTSVYEDGKPIALGGCGGGGTLMKLGSSYLNAQNGGNAYYDAYSYYAGQGGHAGGCSDNSRPSSDRYYVPAKGDYGVGGIGGVGGGAGGAGGTVKTGYHWGGVFRQSLGAAGGKGGDGGDGCIFIYY